MSLQLQFYSLSLHSPLNLNKTRRGRSSTSSAPLVSPSPSHILPSTSHFSLLSSFSAKPIFSKTSVKPPRALTQQKYVYPDPIPEFAEAETRKFRNELSKKLHKSRETFGDDFNTVIDVCAEIFNEFLLKEYGGPGTLLVEPFTDMLLALKEKKLQGAPIAARAALLWAQNYVDHDWEVWTSQ